MVTYGAIAHATYYLTGAGPRLIWLPTAQGHWRFHDLWADALARHFTVFVPTLRGNRDFPTHPDFTWDDLLRDVATDLDALGWDRVWIGGGSFGSALALLCLARMPERFIGAFLYALPWGLPRGIPRLFVLALNRRRAWRTIGSVFRKWSIVATAHEYLRLPEPERRRYRRWFLERFRQHDVPIQTLGRRITLLAELPGIVDPTTIDHPVAVISGSIDRLVRPKYPKRLVGRLRRVWWRELPDLGHLGFQIAPHRVAGILLSLYADMQATLERDAVRVSVKT